MDDKVQLMLKQCEWLRKEIVDSINWQNRSLISGIAIVPSLFAIGIALKDWQVLLIVLPPLVIIFIASWLVEQSRMMRAGDFLQMVEDEINVYMGGGSYLWWENWLRRNWIGHIHIHRIHHLAQYMVIAFLIGLSIIAMIIMWTNWSSLAGLKTQIINGQVVTVPAGLPFGYCWATTILYGVSLLLVNILVYKAVKHTQVVLEDFQTWKKEYEGEINPPQRKSNSTTQ